MAQRTKLTIEDKIHNVLSKYKSPREKIDNIEVLYFYLMKEYYPEFKTITADKWIEGMFEGEYPKFSSIHRAKNIVIKKYPHLLTT